MSFMSQRRIGRETRAIGIEKGLGGYWRRRYPDNKESLESVAGKCAESRDAFKQVRQARDARLKHLEELGPVKRFWERWTGDTRVVTRVAGDWLREERPNLQTLLKEVHALAVRQLRENERAFLELEWRLSSLKLARDKAQTLVAELDAIRKPTGVDKLAAVIDKAMGDGALDLTAVSHFNCQQKLYAEHHGPVLREESLPVPKEIQGRDSLDDVGGILHEHLQHFQGQIMYRESLCENLIFLEMDRAMRAAGFSDWKDYFPPSEP